MILDIKKQIEQWTGKSLRQKKGGLLVRPLLSRLEERAYQILDGYLSHYKKEHYLV